MWKYYLILVVLTCEAPRCHTSYVKRWIRNDNFDEVGNWVEGQAPCSNQRAIFPEEIQGVVMLPYGKHGISGMVLPISGELLLSPDGELTINEESNQNEENSCPIGDKHFKRSKRWYWLDPNNWDLLSLASDKKSWDAVPDAEKIPCQDDSALFEGQSSFGLELPDNFGYAIAGIQINGMTLDDEEWRRFLNSEPGMRMFHNSDRYQRTAQRNLVDSVRTKCTDRSGCLCHPNPYMRPFLMKRMKEVTECPTPKCVRPVTPVGNVCDICGAILQFSIKDSKTFVLDDFKESLRKLVQEATGDESIFSYASKVANGLDPVSKSFIQVVLTEGHDYNERSVGIAWAIENKINKGNFGLQSIGVHRSGYYYDSNGPTSAPWVVLGTLLAVCLMLAVIYYVYVGPKNRINFGFNVHRPQFGIPNILPAAARRSFLFARFDNTSTDGGAVDLAACTASVSQHSIASTLYDMEDTFENTTYSPSTLQEASERAVATFSELKKREQEELLKQEDLMAMDDIEE